MTPTTKEVFDQQIAELEAKRKLLSTEFQNLKIIDDKLIAIEKLEQDVKKLQEDVARRQQQK